MVENQVQHYLENLPMLNSRGIMSLLRRINEELVGRIQILESDRTVYNAKVDFLMQQSVEEDPLLILLLNMVKNKGFLPSGPSEIPVQRNQIKDIIYSLLPACKEPDMDSGIPFKADAIIANPPVYGM
ncbi:unnamed protein product [Camellia sinensis]